MVNHQKFIKYLLSFVIAFSPVLLINNAHAGAEKWELVENVYDKSKNVVNVTAKKITQQAANSSVYKVQVPVNAGTLGSTIKLMLRGGVAVGAITAMVEGVGWIIENGQILKRKDPENVDPSYEYYWETYGKKFPDPMSAFNYWASQTTSRVEVKPTSLYYDNNGATARVDYTYYSYPKTKESVLQNSTQSFNRTKNPNYDPSAKPQLIPVSDTEVGNEATGDGKDPKSSPTPYPDLITDAYSPNNPVSDAPAPKETNNALDSANPEPETEPKGEAETEKEKDKDGNETGKETSKFELPNFCEWAPAVCDFFKVQKQDNKDIKENQNKDLEQNKTFFEKVSDFFDWAKDEEQTDTEIDIPAPQNQDIDTNINFSSACPANFTLANFSYHGFSQNWEVDFSKFCDVFGTYVKPVVIAMGAFTAALIIGGVRTNE